MTTNKKRGGYVRDAADVIDPATDLVRIKAVEDRMKELDACRVAIEKMCSQGVVWLLGLIHANGWTNIEAAKAVGININRVGAIGRGEIDALTEKEVALMLERMLLIDADSSSSVGENSSPEVVAIGRKAS
jgi:hypothetical protein